MNAITDPTGELEDLRAQIMELRQLLGPRVYGAGAAPEPRAAPPSGYEQYADGETIFADHVNRAVGQGVMRFASAAARDAAIVLGDRADGMLAWTADTRTAWRWNAGTGAWEAVGATTVTETAGLATAITTSGFLALTNPIVIPAKSYQQFVTLVYQFQGNTTTTGNVVDIWLEQTGVGAKSVRIDMTRTTVGLGRSITHNYLLAAGTSHSWQAMGKVSVGTGTVNGVADARYHYMQITARQA